jgi:hypothetical protein
VRSSCSGHFITIRRVTNSELVLVPIFRTLSADPSHMLIFELPSVNIAYSVGYAYIAPPPRLTIIRLSSFSVPDHQEKIERCRYCYNIVLLYYFVLLLYCPNTYRINSIIIILWTPTFIRILKSDCVSYYFLFI